MSGPQTLLRQIARFAANAAAAETQLEFQPGDSSSCRFTSSLPLFRTDRLEDAGSFVHTGRFEAFFDSSAASNPRNEWVLQAKESGLSWETQLHVETVALLLSPIVKIPLKSWEPITKFELVSENPTEFVPLWWSTKGGTLDATAITRRIEAALREQRVEDCESHPAQQILENAIQQDRTNAWVLIPTLFVTQLRESPPRAADFLRCIGRLRVGQIDGPTAIEMVCTALERPEVGVRLAAVRAIEHWKTPELIEALGQHGEKDRLLARYIDQVITDLS